MKFENNFESQKLENIYQLSNLFCVIKEITHLKVIMSDSKTSVPEASKSPDNLVTSYEQFLNLEDAETYAKQAEDSMTMNTNSNQGETIEDPDSNLPNRYLVSNREDVKFPQKTAKFKVRIIDGNGRMKLHEVKVCKSEKQKRYNCNKCDRSFARLVDFTEHFTLVHETKSFQCNTTVNEKKKNFICNTCGAGFTKNYSLNRHHTTVHEKKKHFVCNICGASFGQKNGLKAHLAQVHENTKPHKCNTCGSKFTEKGALKKHVARVHERKRHVESVHEKKKGFQCRKCLRTFKRRFALTSHLKSVSCPSRKEVFKCNICQTLLVSEAVLKKHKEQGSHQ